MAATFGSRRSSCPTASRRRWRAWAPSAAVKIDRMIAPSASCWSRRTWPRRSRRKCTVQRCHGTPSTCASAAFRPGCASLMANWDAEQAARDQAPEELAPERLGLRLADVEADDLPPAGLMDSVRDHDALAGHAAAVADLLDLGVDEQIQVAALQRPLPERLHLLIQQPGDPADLGLADTQPAALHQLIDPPSRDPAHIGLLDHRHQRLLRALARLQEAREIAALAQLGDLQLDLPGSGVPAPSPVAVAMRRSIIGPALAQLGADQLCHLGLHELARDRLNRLTDHIRMLIAQHPPDDLLDRHPLLTGHRRPPFVDSVERDDDHERRGGRNRLQRGSVRPPPTPTLGT